MCVLPPFRSTCLTRQLCVVVWGYKSKGQQSEPERMIRHYNGAAGQETAFVESRKREIDLSDIEWHDTAGRALSSEKIEACPKSVRCNVCKPRARPSGSPLLAPSTTVRGTDLTYSSLRLAAYSMTWRLR